MQYYHGSRQCEHCPKQISSYRLRGEFIYDSRGRLPRYLKPGSPAALLPKAGHGVRASKAAHAPRFARSRGERVSEYRATAALFDQPIEPERIVAIRAARRRS